MTHDSNLHQNMHPTSPSKRLLRLTMVISNNFFFLKKKVKNCCTVGNSIPLTFTVHPRLRSRAKSKWRLRLPHLRLLRYLRCLILHLSIISSFKLLFAISLSLFRMLSLRVFIYLPFSIGGVKMCALVPYIEWEMFLLKGVWEDQWTTMI